MRTKLRAATKTDAPFGLAVEEACMRDYAMALWGAWRPSTTLESWDPVGQEVVTEDGHAIGLVATGLEGGFLRIKKLYLVPEHQNQGLGREVLDVMCQRGFDQGLETRLTVLTNNPAIRFYRRAGFEELERNTERIWMVKRCPEA